MAIVKLGPLVVGVRGTVGGSTFSANKAGPYIKAWGRGSNPRTEFQSLHRAKLIGLSQAWKAISTANKDDWNTYAALPAQDLENSLGETYSISGFNWFVRINLNLFSAGESQEDAIPTLGIPAVPGVNVIQIYKTGGSATSRVILFGSDPEHTELHVIKASIFNSLGRIVSSEIKTYIATKLPQGGFPTVTVFQPQLEAKFGTMIEGQIVFISYQTQFADGRRGPAFVGSDEVRA